MFELKEFLVRYFCTWVLYFFEKSFCIIFFLIWLLLSFFYGKDISIFKKEKKEIFLEL